MANTCVGIRMLLAVKCSGLNPEFCFGHSRWLLDIARKIRFKSASPNIAAEHGGCLVFRDGDGRRCGSHTLLPVGPRSAATQRPPHDDSHARCHGNHVCLSSLLFLRSFRFPFFNCCRLIAMLTTHVSPYVPDTNKSLCPSRYFRVLRHSADPKWNDAEPRLEEAGASVSSIAGAQKVHDKSLLTINEQLRLIKVVDHCEGRAVYLVSLP